MPVGSYDDMTVRARMSSCTTCTTTEVATTWNCSENIFFFVKLIDFLNMILYLHKETTQNQSDDFISRSSPSSSFCQNKSTTIWTYAL